MTMWTPVVYGRTHRADKWWRALPVGIMPNGWIADVVNVAVAGGHGLRRPDVVGASTDETSRPEGSRVEGRYLLARRADRGDGVNRANGVLVGVACYARALSKEMHTDEASRELYCFVGWWGTPETPTDIPSLAALTENCARWAGDVYQMYFEHVWKQHQALVRIQESAPMIAPWARDDSEAGGAVEIPAPAPEATATPRPLLGVGPAGLTPQRDKVLLYPASHSERLWDEGRRTTTPFTLVTGWVASARAPLKPVTHLCAADVREPRAVPASVGVQPPPPSTEPDQERHDHKKPDQERHDHKKPDADLLGEILREADKVVTDVGKLFTDVVRIFRSPSPAKNQKSSRFPGQAGHGSVARPGHMDDPSRDQSRPSRGREDRSGQDSFSEKKASPPIKAKLPEKTGDVNELDDL